MVKLNSTELSQPFGQVPRATFNKNGAVVPNAVPQDDSIRVLIYGTKIYIALFYQTESTAEIAVELINHKW